MGLFRRISNGETTHTDSWIVKFWLALAFIIGVGVTLLVIF